MNKNKLLIVPIAVTAMYNIHNYSMVNMVQYVQNINNKIFYAENNNISSNIDNYISNINKSLSDKNINWQSLNEQSDVLTKGYYKLTSDLTFNKQFSSNLNDNEEIYIDLNGFKLDYNPWYPTNYCDENSSTIDTCHIMFKGNKGNFYLFDSTKREEPMKLGLTLVDGYSNIIFNNLNIDDNIWRGIVENGNNTGTLYINNSTIKHSNSTTDLTTFNTTGLNIKDSDIILDKVISNSDVNIINSTVRTNATTGFITYYNPYSNFNLKDSTVESMCTTIFETPSNPEGNVLIDNSKIKYVGDKKDLSRISILGRNVTITNKSDVDATEISVRDNFLLNGESRVEFFGDVSSIVGGNKTNITLNDNSSVIVHSGVLNSYSNMASDYSYNDNKEWVADNIVIENLKELTVTNKKSGANAISARNVTLKNIPGTIELSGVTGNESINFDNVNINFDSGNNNKSTLAYKNNNNSKYPEVNISNSNINYKSDTLLVSPYPSGDYCYPNVKIENSNIKNTNKFDSLKSLDSIQANNLDIINSDIDAIGLFTDKNLNIDNSKLLLINTNCNINGADKISIKNSEITTLSSNLLTQDNMSKDDNSILIDNSNLNLSNDDFLKEFRKNRTSMSESSFNEHFNNLKYEGKPGKTASQNPIINANNTVTITNTNIDSHSPIVTINNDNADININNSKIKCDSNLSLIITSGKGNINIKDSEINNKDQEYIYKPWYSDEEEKVIPIVNSISTNGNISIDNSKINNASTISSKDGNVDIKDSNIYMQSGNTPSIVSKNDMTISNSDIRRDSTISSILNSSGNIKVIDSNLNVDDYDKQDSSYAGIEASNIELNNVNYSAGFIATNNKDKSKETGKINIENSKLNIYSKDTPAINSGNITDNDIIKDSSINFKTDNKDVVVYNSNIFDEVTSLTLDNSSFDTNADVAIGDNANYLLKNNISLKSAGDYEVYEDNPDTVLAFDPTLRTTGFKLYVKAVASEGDLVEKVKLEFGYGDGKKSDYVKAVQNIKEPYDDSLMLKLDRETNKMHWEKYYNITFVNFNNSKIMTYPVGEYITPDDLEDFETSDASYKFKGWYLKNKDGEYEKIPNNLTADKEYTLYAKWDIKEIVKQIKNQDVNAPNTLKNEYNKTLIISLILILSGIVIICYNYKKVLIKK